VRKERQKDVANHCPLHEIEHKNEEKCECPDLVDRVRGITRRHHIEQRCDCQAELAPMPRERAEDVIVGLLVGRE
jgi:hypothetical protein